MNAKANGLDEQTYEEIDELDKMFCGRSQARPAKKSYGICECKPSSSRPGIQEKMQATALQGKAKIAWSEKLNDE